MPCSMLFSRERWILNTVQVTPLWPAIAGGQLLSIKNQRKKNALRQTGAPLKRNSKDTGKVIITNGIILLSEANRFQKLGSLTGMFLSFLNIYEYTIRFLEILCIGHSFDSMDLHQRIKQLAHFVPHIEGVFVKKNGNEYYLVAELEEAKEVAEGGDETRLNDGLFESIAEAELQLHKLVSDRFSKLKKQLKSDALIQQEY